MEKIQWKRNCRGSAETRAWRRISLLSMSNSRLRQISVHCQSGNAIRFSWSWLLLTCAAKVHSGKSDRKMLEQIIPCSSLSAPGLDHLNTCRLFSDPFTHPAKCTLESTATFSQNRQFKSGMGSCFHGSV